MLNLIFALWFSYMAGFFTLAEDKGIGWVVFNLVLALIFGYRMWIRYDTDMVFYKLLEKYLRLRVGYLESQLDEGKIRE